MCVCVSAREYGVMGAHFGYRGQQTEMGNNWIKLCCLIVKTSDCCCRGDEGRATETKWNTVNCRRPKWQTSRIVKLQIANILSFNGIKHMDAVRIIWNANHFIWLDPVMSICYTNSEYTKKHITWMHTAYNRMNW